MFLIIILHDPCNYYTCSLLVYMLYMVLVNIIHYFLIQIVYMFPIIIIRGHFQFIFLIIIIYVHYIECCNNNQFLSYSYTYYTCST